MSARDRIRAALLTLSCASGLAPLLADAVPYRVMDLRTQPTQTSWFHGEVTALPDRFFVYASGPRGLGNEPWTSDGTSAGTQLVRDLAPGSLGSGRGLLGRLGDQVLFAAWTPEAGTEIWRSDGTAAGTARVIDLWPGPGDSDPVPLGVVRGVLVFDADDGVHGRQAFATDGTAPGTIRLSNLLAGVCHPWWGDFPERSPVLGDKLFFCGDDGWHGEELWVTDGSADGTRLVADLFPGPGWGMPGGFRPAAGKMYFTGSDLAHGVELWVTDGSPAGTRRITDIAPAEEPSYARAMGEAGGGMVLAAQPECCTGRLYWTDGAAEVRLLRGDLSVDTGEAGATGWEYGGRVVFFASDNVHGTEPWATDGTSGGTRFLGDLYPGYLRSVYSGAGVGSLGVYFVAIDPGPDNFLWRTDGKPEGTVRLGAVGWGDSLTAFAELGDRDVFGIHFLIGCGHSECDEYELWVTDQTAAGTERLWPADLEFSDSDPRVLIARPGGIVFRALHDTEPWWIFNPVATASDGTEVGTRLLLDEDGETVGFEEATPLPGGRVLFAASWGHGLWGADGDLATRIFEPGTDQPSYVSGLEPGNGLGWFANRLMGWRSDGSAAGTFPLVAPGGEEPYEARDFTAVGSRVWFHGYDEAHGRELWASDGSPGGTAVHDLTPGPSGTIDDQYTTEIAPLDSVSARFLFRSDGDLYSYASDDQAPTWLATISDLRSELGETRLLTTWAGRIYWSDLAAGGSCELWASDGTVPGTQPVAPVGHSWRYYGSQDPCPSRPVSFAGRLWLTACDSVIGCELWTSDGTADGTHPLADLEPGPASLLPTHLTPIGDRLYFSGCAEGAGCEPWETDGSVGGTRRLADLAPGAYSSDPHYFTRSACLVYFAADDGTGKELWAMPVGIFCDGFESGDTSRW